MFCFFQSAPAVPADMGIRKMYIDPLLETPVWGEASMSFSLSDPVLTSSDGAAFTLSLEALCTARRRFCAAFCSHYPDYCRTGYNRIVITGWSEPVPECIRAFRQDPQCLFILRKSGSAVVCLACISRQNSRYDTLLQTHPCSGIVRKISVLIHAPDNQIKGAYRQFLFCSIYAQSVFAVWININRPAYLRRVPGSVFHKQRHLHVRRLRRRDCESGLYRYSIPVYEYVSCASASAGNSHAVSRNCMWLHLYRHLCGFCQRTGCTKLYVDFYRCRICPVNLYIIPCMPFPIWQVFIIICRRFQKGSRLRHSGKNCWLPCRLHYMYYGLKASYSDTVW